MKRAILAGAALLAALAPADRAFADGKSEEKQACLTASDKGQQAKLEGKLRDAREQFLVCSRNECPALVRQDCAQWVTEVMAALPSIVVGARNWQGHDVFAVKVSVDGVVAQESLDGKPIFVDPGAHTFRYESAAEAPVEEKVLVREGEKNRSLTVQFPAPPGAATTATPGPTGDHSPPPPPEQKGGPSPLAYVFTAVGVAALGTALGLDLSANSEVNSDKTTCAPKCSVGDIRAKWDGAWVGVGVGVVSLGVATYFFIARPSAAPPEAKRSGSLGGHPQDPGRLSVEFAPTPHGGVGEVVGRF
jgi:hypothetical protein